MSDKHAAIGLREVVVFGSINVDAAVRLRRLPRPGETVFGQRSPWALGGKGANQAVAARRTGLAPIHLVGRVGEDQEGAFAVSELERHGLGGEHVRTIASLQTGYALVVVDEDGENTIVLDPGANRYLAPTEQEFEMASDAVVLAQGECGPDLLTSLAGRVRDLGSTLILNLAPVVPVDREVLRAVELLVVNQVEAIDAAEMLDLDVPRDAPLEDLARRLAEVVSNVAITLGAAGSLIVGRGMNPATIMPHPARRVVDTTGAGDCWVGVLAASVAAGARLDDAARTATVAAALSVEHPGAMSSFPSALQIAEAAQPVEAP